MSNTLASCYFDVLQKVSNPLVSLGRNDLIRPQLIVVSKGQSLEDVASICKLGHLHFGENRVQEGLEKLSTLKQVGFCIHSHLIGRLQSNKAKEAVSFFDYIHSLDRKSLADALSFQMKAQNRFPKLFIQVNVGNEPQKSGIAPKDFEWFTNYCIDLGLPLIGYMCIPPKGQDARPYFNDLYQLSRQTGFFDLSMGMSADFQVALEYGATFLRVGSKIFNR